MSTMSSENETVRSDRQWTVEGYLAIRVSEVFNITDCLEDSGSCYARWPYRVGQKIAQFMLNPLTLSNINRFSKFFHCQNQEKICNSIITEDPTTPQVCRYTTLWNVSKSWFRLACQEWGRLASSSSSREPRLTANITVNMFSVAVYYVTSVQDVSATPGPCSRTAHRHTLLGTHWRTCGVRKSRSSSLTCGTQTARTWIQSITLFGVPFSRWSINVVDSRQSTS